MVCLEIRGSGFNPSKWTRTMHLGLTHVLLLPKISVTFNGFSCCCFGTCKYHVQTAKRNVPLSETTVRTGHPSAIYCLLFVGCLTSQQHASVSQGRICSDNFTCCHAEIELADQAVYLTQSQYTDTQPTSPSADRITPGAWQGSDRSANF